MAWQYGAQSNGHQNGPAQKKAKTNSGMVTTRYAPPPGYVPPVSTQASSYAAYAQNAIPYGPPYDQAAQAAWAQYNAQYQQAYANHAAYQYAYQQQQYYAAQYGQAYPAAYPTTTMPHTAHPAGMHTNPWSGQWPHPGAAPQANEANLRRRHNSMPDVGKKVLPTVDEHGGASREPEEGDEDYCEYSRPFDFADRESEVQKEYSLGLLINKSAVPSNIALPATWEEANIIALMPPAKEQKYDAAKVISRYYVDEAAKEALVSIRDTSEWTDLQHDLIFHHLPRSTSDLISIADMISQYRDRPASQRPLKRKRYVPEHTSRTIQQSRLTAEQQTSPKSDALDVITSTKKRTFSERDDVVDQQQRQQSRKLSESTSQDVQKSAASVKLEGHHTSGPQAGVKQQEESQEDILARLGVTGQAKPLPQQSIASAEHQAFTEAFKRSTAPVAISSDSPKQSTPVSTKPAINSTSHAAHASSAKSSNLSQASTSQLQIPGISQQGGGPKGILQSDVVANDTTKPSAATKGNANNATSNKPATEAAPAKKESRWTRLAREYQAGLYQVGEKRPLED